ncbi:BAG family molecular chaperone regulator 6 [Sesamum alatum]|uniref:BAG family molecular chaperone regulator 6 n=1 Tax=Sesamum alatum TaxID=300844 RepID=A0AAE1XQ27_9LAMI|nr:BAG family molecular chaperone regulator 6 [Sesamum alatum]
MQSYPYQKDQVNYGPHYYPGTEAVPIPMYVNPVRPPPVNHQFWPWGGNYGYVPPVACHGCCNHTYFPNHYAWGSPYSYVPPVHCPGTYPPFPVQYVPPPSYAMEQPRYEYEKTVPGDHHCCGCPNHLSHQKGQKNVRIEEEETDRERGKNDSRVPCQLKNRPYPIVWLPPDYRNDEEHGKVNNSEGVKDGSLDVQPHGNHGKTVEQQPGFWNGWYPLDLKNLVSSKPRGDRERNHTLQDDGKRSFPFPLLWIPYKAGQQDEEGNNVNGANMKQSLGSQQASGGGELNSIINGDKIGGQSSPRAKDIPVREVKQQEDKGITSSKDKERDPSVKGSVADNGVVKLDNGEKKDPKDGAKRKSASPPKSPKLPPVCLRVDPLPRRKSASGSSRSPSPPGDKLNPDKSSNKSSKAHNPSESKEPDNIHQDEFKEDKGKKTIEVDGKTSQRKSADANVEPRIVVPLKSEETSINKREEKPEEENISQKQAETEAAVTKGHTEDAESARGKNEGTSRAEEVGADAVKESSKTKLSEEEAAVIIQSAYRGFDIRRWEPIKKLKQIAKVREQIAEVKHLIQAMESSPDSQGNSKQRNIIAETIMGLLLKLDTVQGLHPSIREVRKSVVRELVSLQEKLDSLTNESENTSGQESVTQREGDALNKTDKVISSQNANENPTHLLEAQKSQLDRGSNFENLQSFEATPTAHPSDLLEAQQSQLDRGSNYENLQLFETTPTGEEQCEKEKEAAESVLELTIEGEDEKNNEVHQNGEEQCAKEKEAAESVSDLTMEGEDEKNNEVHQNGEEQCAKEKEAAESVSELTIEGEDKKSNEVHQDGVSSIQEADELGQSSEMPLLQNESSGTDIVPAHDDKLESESTELPLGVFGASKNHREIDVETSKDDDLKQPEEGLVKEHIAPESHEGTAGEENKGHIASESHEDTAGEEHKEHIASGSHEDTVCKENIEHVEFHKASNLPPSEVNIQSDAKETSSTTEPLNNCKLDNKSGTEEEMGQKVGDALCEADGGAVIPQENVNAATCESSEASDNEGVLIAESCKGEAATCNTLHDDFGSDTKTSSEEPEEGNSEQDISLINESVNTYEAANITEVKEVTEDKSEVSKADSVECPTQQTESANAGINDHEGEMTEACQEENETSLDTTAMEASTKQGLEDITEQSLPPKDLQDAIDDEEQNTTHDGMDVTLDGAKNMSISQVDPGSGQVSPAKDELTESNKKLIEENERLRDMMQKLIKSGEEQLTAISSLSGRVKDLERRLSRKKKLKLKQCKAPRSSMSSDGSAKQRTLGVAM